jgi:hypothetical protein
MCVIKHLWVDFHQILIKLKTMGNYSTKGFLIFVACCDQLLELYKFFFFNPLSGMGLHM